MTQATTLVATGNGLTHSHNADSVYTLVALGKWESVFRPIF